MVDKYQPKLFVLEGPEGSKLGSTSRRKIRWMMEYGEKRRTQIVVISRKTVREVFAKVGNTKQQIAAAIAKAFPEFRPQLPKPRRAWEAMNPKMAIFDAAAMVLCLPDVGSKRR